MPLLSKNRDEGPAEANGTGRFGRPRRLRRPAEFAAVLAAPRDRTLRAARHWLAMTAAWYPAETSAKTAADAAPVRFGITVGKRNARRAVDRAVVKRIVREAARRAAPALDAACAGRRLRLDVAFRLKAPRDRMAEAALSFTAWRRALRVEADALLQRLERHLAEPGA